MNLQFHRHVGSLLLGVSLMLGVCGLKFSAAADEPLPDKIVFNRDIRPIFSNTCFKCHGPDENKRKAKLRMDVKEDAYAAHKNGTPIVPGKPAKSEVFQRITAKDLEEIMPPAKSGMKLTDRQISLIKRWIEQGADIQPHWAFVTPKRPELPTVHNAKWLRNPIDHFILARLEQEKTKPSPEVDKTTLLRRASFDLTGLPPTPEEVDAFLADKSADAYEKAVDHLLASPHYGERMAMEWLDEARYADTNGYQNDFNREMWPWRDWVISAFNNNLPYSDFVRQQIAGDILPNATREQRIATGFNRNHRTVTEAGSIEEEWLVENVVDRIETTSGAFLALTLGCVRCHEHKYDPIAHKEFYEFFAFFNNSEDRGFYSEIRGNVGPTVQVLSPEFDSKFKELEANVTAKTAVVEGLEAKLPEAQKKWETEFVTSAVAAPPGLALRFDLNERVEGADTEDKAGGKVVAAAFKGNGAPKWVPDFTGAAQALNLDGADAPYVDAGPAIALERTDAFSYGAWIKPKKGTTAILSKMDDAKDYRGFDFMHNEDGRLSVHIINKWPTNAVKINTTETVRDNVWSHVFVTYDGKSKAAGVKVFINGKPATVTPEQDSLSDTIVTDQPLRLGKRSASLPFKGALADVRFYRSALSEAQVKALMTQPYLVIAKIPSAQRTDDQKDALARFFKQSGAGDLIAAEQAVTVARKARDEAKKASPSVMVMQERKDRRPTYVLKRGRYESPDMTQPVQPAVPACLPPLPADAPRNRLGLAEWMVSPQNPLTARVRVNRYWAHYFGIGLVKTQENFGAQGEYPSHPELLDWLATEFIRTGWDVKAMQKLIVTSATYRQSSHVTPLMMERDPENRLLARGPRFRLPAELVRDNVLAIGGLLSPKLGGPPVKPYQPDGLWAELAGGVKEEYRQDKGESLYRRSLYMFWKRTVPPPQMTTFDAPSREVCLVKRSRTNTPLQALELLNDVAYVEAARRLAEHTLTERPSVGASERESVTKERITYAFRRATARLPDEFELKTLQRGLQRYQEIYRADPKAAQQLISMGESKADPKLDVPELAAYTMLANVIMNLDEVITKE